MLQTSTPLTALATTDLDRAKAFYEGLGFTVRDTSPFGSLVFTAGDGGFLVYESQFAGTNKATAMTFLLPGSEFETAMAALRAAGVTFDTFEMEGAEWDGEVLTMESMRSAWFRDPDGNIIAVGTED